jgi:hypothetical protein
MNVGGWLVLNGAVFLNSEYPDLAATLREAYASTGYTPPDPDRTMLVNEPHQTKPNGEIVRGAAICPSRALCGDYVGTIQPFDLDASL